MKKKKRWLGALIVAIAALLLIAGGLSYYNWQKNYRHRAYPGIKIGDWNLAGLDRETVSRLLAEKVEKFSEDGLTFLYNGNPKNLPIDSSSFDVDLSRPLVSFDQEATIKHIFEPSDGNFLGYLGFLLRGKEAKNLQADYLLDNERLDSELAALFPELNIAAENAYFSASARDENLQINKERIGKTINYELVRQELTNSLNRLENTRIELKTKSEYPEIKAEDLELVRSQASGFVSKKGLNLTFEDGNGRATSTKSWLVSSAKIIGWLSAAKQADGVSLALDQEKIAAYLSATIAPKIDIEPVRPRFQIVNGKVSSWESGASGRQLDATSSAATINAAVLAGQKEAALNVIAVEHENLEDGNDLDIREIIGTGHSNFKGSSANRIKNIKVGAAAVSGSLIAPGEEFSLVKILGEVDAEHGYYPELVIKGDKTEKEYGGGLCQIATTLFRSALESGLPITYRRNHSYRVSYYEPAGTDAAVYIPEPDVRFINDTPGYILIQERISGNDIYFDFWGIADGRIATTSAPVVYNIVKPKPTKYIETETLDPGQTKCTEKAHNGADAYFDYKVVYPEGSTSTPVAEKRFSSHYVPWQEVCLIGKAAPETSASSSPVIEDGASSTPVN